MFYRTLLLGLIGAILSIQALAGHGDSKTFIYDSSDLFHEFDLSSRLTHTEYDYEEVEDTCSREVFDGYRTVCSAVFASNFKDRRICTRTNGRTVCSGGGNGSGGSYSGGGGSSYDNDDDDDYTPTCRQEADYRTEYYSCTRTIAIPYEVHDYDTKANIKIELGEMPPGFESRPTFTLNLSEYGSLSLSAKNAPGLIVLGKFVSEDRDRSSDPHLLDALARVRFVPAKKVMAPVQEGMSSIKVEDKKLSFVIGKVSKPDDFYIDLKAWRVRWFIAKDRKQFDGRVKKSQYKLEDFGEKTKVTVDLRPLMKFHKKKKKYRFEINVGIVKKPEVINSQEISSFVLTKKYKQKIAP